MRCRKGFTLIELMVVILIVGILAAVAIPIMRGRVDSAKWTEGKAMAGTIATAIRAYAAEKGILGTYGDTNPPMADLGFVAGDLDGTYFKFSAGGFSWTSGFTAGAVPPLTYTITATAPTGVSPSSRTLDNTGAFNPP